MIFCVGHTCGVDTTVFHGAAGEPFAAGDHGCDGDDVVVVVVVHA